MKRLLMSVGGGFALPFLYSILVGPLSQYIGDERIRSLLWLPIGWPKILYISLFPPFSGRSLNIGLNLLLVINVAGNVIFYGALTYFFLLWLSLRKSKTPYYPPLPTEFSKGSICVEHGKGQ
jgi:hypothetical protein